MGKKRRRPAQPDDWFQHGPIRLARFGRQIVIENLSTPEEHAELVDRLSEPARVEVLDALLDVQYPFVVPRESNLVRDERPSENDGDRHFETVNELATR